MAEALIPDLPAEVPRKGNRLTRWIGRCLLRVLGWRVVGEFPAEPKVIVAVAPHTSNWDFVTAMAGIMAVGMRVNYLMKKEAFIWPLSTFFVWLGGVPLDRKATANTVDQIVAHYQKNPQLWVAIAPEGTRKKVDYWKAGFLRVAEKAKVPVLLVAWNYPKKELVIDQIWPTTGDVIADAEAIRQSMCSRFSGRYPDKQ